MTINTKNYCKCNNLAYFNIASIDVYGSDCAHYIFPSLCLTPRSTLTSVHAWSTLAAGDEQLYRPRNKST